MKKIGLFLAVGAAVVWWRLRPFRVEIEGDSMEPALRDGDWAVAIATPKLRKGDIVVLEHPERPSFELVKRIHALDDGEVFVVGDNEDSSTDSRDFGPVPSRTIKGVLMAVYWPRRALVVNRK